MKGYRYFVAIYGNKILPVVLYGCETWSRMLRKKRKFSVFEKRMLRRIFGLKRGRGPGNWKKVSNK